MSGVNSIRQIELDNGMRGFFKPIAGEHARVARSYGHERGQQAINEAAAWQLASRLGDRWADVVAPCVMREMGGEIGSFSLERPGANLYVGRVRDLPEWKDAAFFDALIGQQDRHRGNFLVAGDRLMLIDHGFSLGREGNYVNNAVFQTERYRSCPDLTSEELVALDKLLGSPDLLGLQQVLTPDGAKALRQRAKKMRQSQQILKPGC